MRVQSGRGPSELRDVLAERTDGLAPLRSQRTGEPVEEPQEELLRGRLREILSL